MKVLISDLDHLAGIVCRLDDRRQAPNEMLLLECDVVLKRIYDGYAGEKPSVQATQKELKELQTAFGLIFFHKKKPPTMDTISLLHGLIIKMLGEHADKVYAPDDEAA